MIDPSIRTLTLAAAFAACTLSLAATAQAAPFDGSWSVLVITRRGTCEPSYRFGVMIYNGVVTSGGGASVAGRVLPNGRVSVAVSGGPGTAYGSGRLTRAGGGGGSWRGSGPSGACSGVWSAQRGY
jgi:hypothetical protein